MLTSAAGEQRVRTQFSCVQNMTQHDWQEFSFNINLINAGRPLQTTLSIDSINILGIDALTLYFTYIINIRRTNCVQRTETNLYFNWPRTEN